MQAYISPFTMVCKCLFCVNCQCTNYLWIMIGEKINPQHIDTHTISAHWRQLLCIFASHLCCLCGRHGLNEYQKWQHPTTTKKNLSEKYLIVVILKLIGLVIGDLPSCWNVVDIFPGVGHRCIYQQPYISKLQHFVGIKLHVARPGNEWKWYTVILILECERFFEQLFQTIYVL